MYVTDSNTHPGLQLFWWSLCGIVNIRIALTRDKNKKMELYHLVIVVWDLVVLDVLAIDEGRSAWAADIARK